jgi:hypothetical protein
VTTRTNRAYPGGTRRPGTRPRAATGLVHISEILARICGCGGTAVLLFEANARELRKIQACTRCAPQARAWAARAGPVRETRLAPDQPPEAAQEDSTTLF